MLGGGEAGGDAQATFWVLRTHAEVDGEEAVGGGGASEDAVVGWAVDETKADAAAAATDETDVSAYKNFLATTAAVAGSKPAAQPPTAGAADADGASGDTVPTSTKAGDTTASSTTMADDKPDATAKRGAEDAVAKENEAVKKARLDAPPPPGSGGGVA